jgi:chromosomal replication initiator protein
MTDYFKEYELGNISCTWTNLINILENINPIVTNSYILHIERQVCNYFNISVEQLHKSTRKRETVQARQIAMYFSKSLTKCSLATIGTQIGGKDHATVLHACKTVNNLMETDKHFKHQVEEIEMGLKYKL